MNKIKNKDGFVSIVAIILGATFLITFLWLTLDLSYFVQQNRSTKNILDNASASAVTRVDESTLGSGDIKFLKNEVEEMAMSIIRNDLFLDENNNPLPQSPLREKPEIQVLVVDNVNKEFGTKVDVAGVKNIKVKNPSVIIYAKLPIRGLFLRDLGPTYQHISASQVSY